MAQHTQQDTPANTVPPEVALEQVLDVGELLVAQGQTLIENMFRTWNLYQLLIFAGLLVIAHLLRRFLGPPIRNWMATRENWPKWRMRVLVVVHQRLRAIFFVVLIWAVIAVMREVTWPSRSYILGIIGTLAFAWLVIVFATRLIKSPLLRKMVRYGAWVWVTLQILGLLDVAERLLDSIGFSIGEMRFSLLLLVQGLVILIVLVSLARFFTTTTAAKVKANADISPSMQVLIVKGVQIAFYGAAGRLPYRRVW